MLPSLLTHALLFLFSYFSAKTTLSLSSRRTTERTCLTACVFKYLFK